MRRTEIALLAIGNAAGALAFFWPFVFSDTPIGTSRIVPFAWALALPVLLVITIESILRAKADVRMLAMIAALASLAAASRPLGAGAAGLEPIWAVLLLSGRALGARAGFVIGALAMAVSAIVTGGIGPWLPYQMMVAAWVGALPGFLPSLRGRMELALLAMFGALTGLATGSLLNLWFWPLAVGIAPEISFVPGAGALTNLEHWLRYGLLTSAGFDIPRAIITSTLLVVSAPKLLPILRRATRRASFAAVLGEE